VLDELDRIAVGIRDPTRTLSATEARVERGSTFDVLAEQHACVLGMTTTRSRTQ
jgi:hypothetical protein